MRRIVGARVNRTGIATAPDDAEKTVQAAREATPSPNFDGQGLAATRLASGRSAGPVGSMPAPVPTQGAAKSALDARQPAVFLDLIGARLAFERTGTRLYEALLVKLESAESPRHEDLERMRDEELQHVGLLSRAVEALGGDPTALTPAADLGGMTTRGLVDAITDPRSTMIEAVEAILAAELVDNDGWLVLADLAARLGHDELAAQFRHAMAEEEEHLARVRAWLVDAVDAEAGLAPEAPHTIEPLHPPHPH